MILDVISNEASHKNYIFLKNVHEKVFQICNHGYKMLHVYISVMVPDRPIHTIIYR